ncbi:MAG: RecQ family zinc-binding domain-containing protein, partial [Bacteroidales bacterium]|nr:RecQ family zinc-binding domain-containing protein [Bacteroidales bacterium]
RTDAMEEFLTNGEECRSRQLLRYFGQTRTEDCGTCDVCRARSAEDRTRSLLLRFYREHEGATLQDLKAFVSNPENGMPPDALRIYRKMADEGVLN